MKVFYFSLLFIFIGCGTSNKVNSQHEYDYKTLLQESHGGYDTPKQLVIKNTEELKEIYAQINKTRKPGFSLPTIDFDKDIVLALFMGQKNSGGYSIKIESISDIDSKTIQVSYKEIKPDGMATMAITKPFYFFKLQKLNKDIVFKKVE